MHRQQIRAFTIIELLVVVSIIALLVSLLLPAIGKAKSKSNEVVCGTRLHSLGLATLTYLAEFDNTFPLNGILFPKGDLPSVYASNPKFTSAPVTDSDQWRPEFGALWPIMGGQPIATPAPFPALSGPVAKALLCPDDSLIRTSSSSLTMIYANHTSTVNTGPEGVGYWSYSVNSVLNSLGHIRDHLGKNPGWADPLKATSIQNPSDLLVFIEEDEGSLFNDEVFDAPAFNAGDRLTGRHRNGGNVAFADGHMEWFSQLVFNEVPNGASGNAARSPYTRMFFPDSGDFLR